MPYSLTFVCSLPFSTVIVSPSWTETTLAIRAKADVGGINVNSRVAIVFFINTFM